MSERRIFCLFVALLLAGTVAFAGGTKEGESGKAQPQAAAGTGGYKEAPMLAAMVKDGKLPPVKDRLPQQPVVIKPWKDQVGKYGGTWRELNQRDDTAYEALQYYESLLRFRMYDYEVIPNLIEKWDVKDGKVFTLYIHKGIKWSDGQPFNADDIEFFVVDVLGTPELYPSYPTYLLSGGEKPKFEKLDEYTVRFSYTKESALFLRQIAQPQFKCYVPKHYLQQFHPKYAKVDDLNKMAKDKGMDNWARLFLNRMAYNINADCPVVTAWKRESTQTDGATYVRNPYYWKVDTAGNQLPYIDKIQVSGAANTEVAQMKTFSGEHDLDMFVVGQFPRDTMVLKENEAVGKYKVIDAPIAEPNVFVLGLNLNHKDPVLRQIFLDKRFRIAMSQAINREDIRKLIYLGQPKEIRQVAPKRESPFYHEGAAQSFVKYDPARANALLDEMGLKRGPDGIRLRPDGKPLEIVVETYSFRDDFQDALEMIGKWWTEVGVRATPKAIEGSLFTTRRNSGDFDASADFAGNGLWPLLNPADYIPVNSGNNYAPLWGLWYNTKGKQGIEPPPEVKRQLELYDQALVTADQAKQVALWKQIMDIQAENLFHMGICDRATVPVPVSNRMRNVPNEGWDCEWVVGNIGTTNPEQFWFAQ